MLVLTRKKNQSIVIGNNITVTICEINGTDKVRIGITAPKDIPVHRNEVLERIKRDQIRTKTE